MNYIQISNQPPSLPKLPQRLHENVNIRPHLAGLLLLPLAQGPAPEGHQSAAPGHWQAKAAPPISQIQGPPRIRLQLSRPAFPSAIPKPITQTGFWPPPPPVPATQPIPFCSEPAAQVNAWRILHSVQSVHRDHMLSLPSQATRAQRLSGSHSRTRVVLRRWAFLHFFQMHRASCTVESMPLLGRAQPRSPQQGVPRLQEHRMCCVPVNRPHHHKLPTINPSASPYPEPTSAKSTSYVPRPATVAYPDYEPPAPYAADNRQPCFSFNNRRCIRQ